MHAFVLGYVSMEFNGTVVMHLKIVNNFTNNSAWSRNVQAPVIFASTADKAARHRKKVAREGIVDKSTGRLSRLKRIE
jgi:hypothetical protein